MHWVNLTWPLVVLGAATAHAQAGETKLVTTAGTYERLEVLFRGKPAVVFYEDKDSTSLNQALKDVLFKAGRERGLLDAVSVVAIANVQGFDWFPARNFVVASVKQTEKGYGIPIYLDWSAALQRAPWALSATGSTVLIVDRSGAERFRFRGRLDDAQRAKALSVLEGLLAEPK